VTIQDMRRVGAIVVLGLALLASACDNYDFSTQGASTAGSEPLSLGIASPSDNGQVTTPFEVQLDSSVPLGSPETGRHHVHLYYDTATPTGEYDLVYGDRAQVTTLPPGTHTILASLRNANHGDAGPRALISVTVGGSGAVTPQPGGETVPVDSYGY
jgi:hypothetical protein